MDRILEAELPFLFVLFPRFFVAVRGAADHARDEDQDAGHTESYPPPVPTHQPGVNRIEQQAAWNGEQKSR